MPTPTISRMARDRARGGRRQAVAAGRKLGGHPCGAAPRARETGSSVNATRYAWTNVYFVLTVELSLGGMYGA